jgi:hypothetical protein
MWEKTEVKITLVDEERMKRYTLAEFMKENGGPHEHSPAMWMSMFSKLEPAPPKEEGVYAWDGKVWRDVFTVPTGESYTIHGPAIKEEK